VTWFLENFARLAAERTAIAELESEAGWLAGTRWGLEGATLYVEAVIRIEGDDYPVRMLYPELFPAAPIVARPQDASARWSGHQYGDGTLCLEWGPDTWHEEVTGRQMLESAHRLLSIEHRTAPLSRQPAPSRHQVTTGQFLRFKCGRFCVGDALRDRLTSAPAGVSLDFTLHFQAKSFLAVIQTVTEEGASWENPDVPRSLRRETDSALLYRAVVHRLPVVMTIPPDTVSGLNVFLAEHGLPKLPEATEVGAGLKPLSILLLDAAGTPHFLFRFEDSADLLSLALVNPGGGNVIGRLPAEYQLLAEKSVGIIGLGSIGSKLAEILGRTGVGRFLLVDDDVFLPENVVRHALDLHNTGEHKVDAVAAALERIAPSVQVESERVHLTGQESNAIIDGVLRKLGRCDLLIDATANPRVFNLLAAVARAKSKPLVWMEVFAGGTGGLIARSRPESDPSPALMRRAYHQFTVENPAPQDADAGDYAVNAEGRILAATDADVSVIAALAAELALDVLIVREPSRFPHSMYLVGLARSWMFEAPLQVLPIATDHFLSVDAPAAAEPGDINAGVDFIRSLLDKLETCA